MMFRDKAKKPIFETKTYIKYGFVIMEREYTYCPNCRDIIDAGPEHQPNYCGNCGQKIDFNGAKWKKEKQLGFLEGQKEGFKIYEKQFETVQN